MHVLPGRFNPVPIQVSRLVVPDQEIIHALIIFAAVVLAKCDPHIIPP
ncbi:MAG: hypothetical protein PVG14_05140 [Anaerolineales bacterium]